MSHSELPAAHLRLIWLAKSHPRSSAGLSSTAGFVLSCCMILLDPIFYFALNAQLREPGEGGEEKEKARDDGESEPFSDEKILFFVQIEPAVCSRSSR